MAVFDAFAPIWNAFLVHPLLSLLVLAYDLLPDFGLAVVVITVAIRLALYPLYVTQIRSSRAMQELAPAMNELKNKYGKDRQKLTEEQMKLYKEHGYNPASGCLPLLLQMPILFAMYAAFIQAPTFTCGALRDILLPFVPIPPPATASQCLDMTAHWLPWITDGLQHPDPLHVLPVVAGAAQLFASVMAMPRKQVVSADPQQRMFQSMAYYFPLMTVVFAWGFASGLAVYWIASTLFQVGQQYFVTGWGQLPRWLPLLARVPTPADREMRRRETAALAEERRDMQTAEAPGAQRRQDEGGRRRGRRRGRR